MARKESQKREPFLVPEGGRPSGGRSVDAWVGVGLATAVEAAVSRLGALDPVLVSVSDGLGVRMVEWVWCTLKDPDERCL